MARKGVPLSDEHRAKLKEAAAARRERERAPLTNVADCPDPRPVPPFHDKGEGRRLYPLPQGDLYLECFRTGVSVLNRAGAGPLLKLTEVQQDALRDALVHWRSG